MNRCVETLFQKTYFTGHKIKKRKKGKKIDHEQKLNTGWDEIVQRVYAVSN